MSWVKIDDRAPEHRKQLAAGPIACWLWVCGLAYCNRQKSLDGFIPAAAIGILYPIPGVEKHAQKLCETGLWERCEHGFIVHDYADYCPNKPYSTSRASAGRIGGLRSGEARRAKQNEASCFEANEANAKPLASSKTKPYSDSYSDAREQKENPPNPPRVVNAGESEPRVTVVPEPPAAPRTGKLSAGVVSFGRSSWIAAYEDAVTDARHGGEPWTFPAKAFGALVSVIEKHCTGENRKDIQGWLVADVTQFVESILGSDNNPSFWSNFGPDGLLRWHNAQRPGVDRPSDPIKNTPQVEAMLAAKPIVRTPEESAQIRAMFDAVLK